MSFAEVFGVTANTLRLCGLVRPICFAVEPDDELKLFDCKTAITVFA